jgi:hypothetical protein
MIQTEICIEPVVSVLQCLINLSRVCGLVFTGSEYVADSYGMNCIRVTKTIHIYHAWSTLWQEM